MDTQVGLSLVLFMAGDSVIAFKNLLVYLLGTYIFTVLKAVYGSVRPYWVEGAIDTYSGHCFFDFPMPAISTFNVFFYSMYNLFMYKVKYTEKVNYSTVCILFFLITMNIIALCFLLLLFGLNYMYQQVITLVYSIIYMMIVIQYDNQILKFSERLGFRVRTARNLKFTMMIVSILMLVFNFFILKLNQDRLSDTFLWIINSTVVSSFSFPS